MRSYVIASGVIFALLTLVHVWRMIEEPHLGKDPWFVLVTLVAAAFSVGAWRVSLKQSHR